MTIGFGPRTLMGTWLRERRWQHILNVLAFRRHWQLQIRISLHEWRR
jgi:hypothetical protein